MRNLGCPSILIFPYAGIIRIRLEGIISAAAITAAPLDKLFVCQCKGSIILEKTEFEGRKITIFALLSVYQSQISWV